MKDHNHIAVHGWMVNRLHLAGNELLCYAFIFGFSQDGYSECKSTLLYIAESINATKSNTQRIIKRLCEKNLIRKKDRFVNGVRYCSYSHNPDMLSFEEWCCRNDNGVAETTTAHCRISNKSLPNQQRGVVETTTKNNIDNIISNTKDIVVVDARARNEVNENFPALFMAPERTAKIQALCMNLHISEYELRRVVSEVWNEWQVTEQRHADFNEAARHMVNQIRIKLNDKQKQNGNVSFKQKEREDALAGYKRALDYCDEIQRREDEQRNRSGNL